MSDKSDKQEEAERELAATEKAEAEMLISLANAEKVAAEERKRLDELEAFARRLSDDESADTTECCRAEKKRDKALSRWSDATQQVQRAGDAVRAAQRKIYKLAHRLGDKRPDLFAREAAWKQEMSKALNRTVQGTPEYREDQKLKAKKYLTEAAKAREDAQKAEKELEESRALYATEVEEANRKAARSDRKATEKAQQIIRLRELMIQNLGESDYIMLRTC